MRGIFCEAWVSSEGGERELLFDVPEPFIRGAHEARKVTLDVLNVVQLGCERVLHVDDEDFPVCLALVEEGHDAKDFDLLDLPDVTHLFADLAYVQWVVVTPGLGLCVLLSGILPSLQMYIYIYIYTGENGG